MLWHAEREIRNTAACKLLCSYKLASPSSRAFRRELHCGQLRRSSSNGNARTGWSYAIFWKLNRRSRMLVGRGFMLCSWMLFWWRFPPPLLSCLRDFCLRLCLSLMLWWTLLLPVHAQAPVCLTTLKKIVFPFFTNFITVNASSCSLEGPSSGTYTQYFLL